MLTLLVLVVVLPASLYIPVVQDWVCQAVVSWLNSSSPDLVYEVGTVRITFPLQLRVNDVTVTKRQDGSRLLHLGSLQTGLDDIPLHQSCFVLDGLQLADVAIDMDSLTASMGLVGALERAEFRRIEIDAEQQHIYLRELSARGLDVHLYMGPSLPDTSASSQPWTVAVDRVLLQSGRVGLQMSDVSLPNARRPMPASPYLDHRHLLLDDIDLAVQHVVYDSVQIAAQVEYLRAREAYSGLAVSQFAAAFRMVGDCVDVEDLDLTFDDENYLRGKAALDLRLLAERPAGEADVSLQAAIDSVHLVTLAATYLPDIREQWMVREASHATVDMRLDTASLDLRRLEVDIPRHLWLTAVGQGQHILHHERRVASLLVKGDLQDVDPLLSAFVAPLAERSYRLPAQLYVDMDVTQHQRRATAHVAMQQRGQEVMKADARYDVETEAYQLMAVTQGLNVSEFMPGIVADRMFMRVQADGRHFDVSRRSTRLDASLQVDSLYFLDESGRRDSLVAFAAEASLIDGNYMAELASRHPTMSFDAQVEGCYRRDTVSAAGHLNVRRADLAHLPYVDAGADLGILRMESHFDAGYDWYDNAHLRMEIDTLSYDEGDYRQHYADIRVSMDSRKDWLVADVTGGDALLGIWTDRSVAQLPSALDTLMSEVDRQLQVYRPDFASVCEHLPRMDVQLRMARQNPFSQALEHEAGITFDRVWLTLSNDQDFRLTGQIHNFADVTGGTSFDTIAIDMQPAQLARAYDYRLFAQHQDIRDTRAYDIHASGRLMPDSLTAGLRYVNGRHKTVYDVLASLALGNDTMTLHLEQGPTLYEQPFSVNRDNFIRLMKYSDLETTKPETQARLMMDGPRDLQLHLYTRKMPNVDVGNQLLVLARNLDLGYASQLMEWEGGAAGRLDMTTAIDLFPDSLYAWSRTGIRDFAMGDYRADTIAVNVTAQAAPDCRDLYGSLALDNVVRVRFDASMADSADIRARLNQVPLTLLSAFLPRNIQLRGTTTGRFNLQGPDIDHATINGGLSMANADLTYTDLNARLRFPADTIRFAKNRLMIRDYQLMADNENPITVRGLVDMSRNLSDPSISLTVKGDNVRLINSRKLELKDQYIYGRLPISTDIKVSGSLSNMSVTGRLNVLSGTNLQYFMQDDPLEASSQVDRLVEFVRFDDIDRIIRQGRRRRDQASTVVDDELRIELKIDLASDAKVTAHLAGTDHNRVEIVGGAGLTLQSGNDGNMLMSGTYSIVDGKVDYKLPILPMVKTFRIANTSDLQWQGSDPGNPAINITATEEVKTTVNDDAGSRVVKFLVSINITGTLDALNLTFDCTAPEDGAISSDIASLDADERSKAALMLLIAQTYVGPGNSSSMGLGTANAALNSMLNREMDSMLSGMKGTNIDLGIDTYNTDAGNTRTNYSVKVSQNFFNDRFRATIGGQVSSGGDVGQSSGARLGDISLEWLIKKDGSHLMRLFRTTNYESVLEGELIETGISYVQERSGYRLRQLFIPTSRKRQQQVQTLIRQMQEQEAEAERASRMQRFMPQPADSTSITDTIPQHETPLP